MRVAIIGAGAAGLASARHVTNADLDCQVLELAPDLGGTWLYTDDVGKDKYGYPVYSAMYKGLRTNLPKEVMGFPDYPVPDNERSYLTQEEILKFLNMYADYFDLRKHIKFNRYVINIAPLKDNRWEITSIDKPSKKEITEQFDAVMICNGHYNDPYIPTLDGQKKFKGTITHSRNYRSPEAYKRKRVLIIGAGPSGLDVTLQISAVASKIVLSHHCKEAEKTIYPENVEKKPDLKRILGKEKVEFEDGTCSGFDTIILCTGYNYSFPFLHKSCGITVEENHIKPLYKHMINIEKPTMCFIGIPFNVCAFQMFDLQARYFVKYISGKMKLPSKEMMEEDTDHDQKARYAKGYSKRQAHMMGPEQRSYYNDLAFVAHTTPIAPVIVKLRDQSVRRLFDNLLHFREDKYKILDEETFAEVL